jgi:hypothetical protein
MPLPDAESLNYWKTSRTAPSTWIEKAKEEIDKIGGSVLAEAFGREESTGRAAYMLAFEIEGERFKVVWPVLPTRTGNEGAARRQAATMLFHDVKQRCISAQVLGARRAFFTYLQLPDGRVAGQLSAPQLLDAVPELLGGTALPYQPE